MKSLRLPSGRGGFTLAEVMISMAILLIIVGIALSCQMYGLRMFEYVKPKLNASDDARRALALMIDEVRTASIVRIGNGSGTNFTEIAANLPQQGNAIQIYSGANMSNFSRFYCDASDQKLKRLTDAAVAPAIVAHSVSNQLVFTSEDFAGNLLTNNQNNRVIGLTLEFYQIQYPATAVGPGNFYDYYRLRTKITRRALF